MLPCPVPGRAFSRAMALTSPVTPAGGWPVSPAVTASAPALELGDQTDRLQPG